MSDFKRKKRRNVYVRKQNNGKWNAAGRFYHASNGGFLFQRTDGKSGSQERIYRSSFWNRSWENRGNKTSADNFRTRICGWKIWDSGCACEYEKRGAARFGNAGSYNFVLVSENGILFIENGYRSDEKRWQLQQTSAMYPYRDTGLLFFQGWWPVLSPYWVMR